MIAHDELAARHRFGSNIPPDCLWNIPPDCLHSPRLASLFSPHLHALCFGINIAVDYFYLHTRLPACEQAGPCCLPPPTPILGSLASLPACEAAGPNHSHIPVFCAWLQAHHTSAVSHHRLTHLPCLCVQAGPPRLCCHPSWAHSPHLFVCASRPTTPLLSAIIGSRRQSLSLPRQPTSEPAIAVSSMTGSPARLSGGCT